MASPNPTAPPPIYGMEKKEEAYQNTAPSFPQQNTAPQQVYNTQPQNFVNTYQTVPVVPVFGRNQGGQPCQKPPARARFGTARGKARHGTG